MSMFKGGAVVSGLALGLFTSMLPAADAPPARVPIEDFVKSNQFSHPVLSPDGKHLAVTMRIKEPTRDVPLLVVYDLSAMKQVGTVRLPGYEVPDDYTWVTNRRLVVSTAREYGSRERPSATGELLGMDLDGSKQEYLYGYNMFGRSKRGSIMPDDRGSGTVAFIPPSLDGTFLLEEDTWEGSRTSLYSIDSNTAARRLVTDVGVPRLSFLMQTDGKPGFAYGLDETARRVLFHWSAEKRQWTQAPGENGPGFAPVGFVPDNSAFYATVITRAGADGVANGALTRTDVATGEHKVLMRVSSGDANLILRGPRPSQPFAVGTREGRPTVQYIDPENPEAKLHAQLSAQFPNSFVWFNSFSSDGQKLLFSVASDRDPGEYFLMDRQSMKAERIFSSMSWLDPSRMGVRRPISFKARDGLELHGYLTVPAGYTSGALPMVLIPHGGPHFVRDAWFFDTDAQFLASRGYAVLQVNYRGSSGRGLEYEHRGYRQWGTAVQDDLIDGVQWAISQKVADAGRVCVYGASFGAYSAMMSSIRQPDMFKCAVGYAGLYDLGLWFDEPRTKREKSRYNYLAKVIGTDPAEQAAQSPARLAAKINVPVMLVHGDKDPVTIPEQAEAMHAALTKAGKPHEWIMVPDEGHGFYAEKNRLMFYQRLEAFLAKHLGP